MAKYKLPVNKQSVASELKVNLGPDTSARQNGSVGGSMVKKTFEYINGRI
ncbi:spore protein alpha/beta [Dehalobacter sp. MCB1]|nr:MULTISPECIES: small, acid-soluble spore protein, alpha/beta type [unclassified Dehalobacter]RJE48472.1 spore protein alpha/beta [Dehalobacter sp. MCB1]TCX52218.1 acid-soluble spore protein [Dehalobacter sp. 12DCB1]